MPVFAHPDPNDPTHPHRVPTILFRPTQPKGAKASSQKHTAKATRTKSSWKHKKRSVAHVPTLRGDPLIESK